MSDEITELKRKVAELEARQQATQAPSKPNPGDVPNKQQPRLHRYGAAIVLALLVVVGFGALTKSPATKVQGTAQTEAPDSSVNKAVIAELRPQVAKCKTLMAQHKATGTIGDVREMWRGAYEVEFDEIVWNGLTYKDKLRAALMVFCSLMPDDGRSTVILRGLHTHEKLSSIVNGNHF